MARFRMTEPYSAYVIYFLKQSMRNEFRNSFHGFINFDLNQPKSITTAFFWLVNSIAKSKNFNTYSAFEH